MKTKVNNKILVLKFIFKLKPPMDQTHWKTSLRNLKGPFKLQ